ncbi:MAG: VWA domain-containing protein [Pyrinomonadaceae bacterium]|jgi:VWFA-related protein|nr:VWA domain-containing protein [Pyrinomonadaceae bacterium]
MKKAVFVITLFFLLNLINFAQTPTPTPPEKDEDVVVISTNLIQIDVTVTDKNGNIVKNLKPEDFEILENGKKQNISNFSFISTVSENTNSAKTIVADKNSVLPTKPLKPEQNKRTIALVVDDLTLSFQSTAYVRKALKQFVDEQMQEGDLVAIIRTGAGMGALQQFTNDKRLLYAAIEKVKWNSMGIGKIGSFDAIGTTFSDLTERTNDLLNKGRGGNSGNLGSQNRPLQTDEKKRKNLQIQLNEFQQNVFGAGTLGALNYIVRGMKEVSGRKSIVLFSDGLSLNFQNDNGVLEPNIILESLRRLTDLANRSSVVVYTIDARGLQTLGLTSQDNLSELTSQKIEQRLNNRRTEFFNTQEGLNYLSVETGGFPIFNSNDLNKGLQTILDNQKGYYLIGYEPNDETFDPLKSRYNKLSIKVKRKDLKVRYRSGFFGITDEKVLPKENNLYNKTLQALASPFTVNEIPLKLNALFGNDSDKGSFIRTFLHISAKDLKFIEQNDGTKKATFSLIAINYGENGVAFDKISNTYDLSLKAESMEKVLKDGFVYDFIFPMEKFGAYQMRIALIDNNTEKIGSASQFIEVPDLKKKFLTISDVVLENLTLAQWENLSKNPNEKIETNPAIDTSLRKFKRNSILRYGFEIYNVNTLNATKNDSITTKIRLYQDENLIYEGKEKTLDINGQTDFSRLQTRG